MKINLHFPRNDTGKQYEIDDDRLRKSNLFEYRLGQDIDGTIFNEEWTGYILRITGGSDKDGFPMTQGVLVASRVHLLLRRGMIGYQAWRGRSGERRRKSVRGCIVGPDIAVLNMIVVKTGDKDIEGITDVQNPRRLGPKRASKIRKLFGLGKDDDVRQFVVRRKVEKEGKKPRMKAPKIQRLITPTVRARRQAKITQRREKLKQNQEQRREYLQLLSRRRMAARQRKQARGRRQREAELKQLAVQMGKAPAAATTKKTTKK
jgi:small subunit ribosomal protein S6e